MVRRLAVPAALTFLLIAPPAGAQPVGPRFQVNQFVVGDQGGPMSCGYYKRLKQDVASDAAGNFVVVWSNNDSYYTSEIVARRYDRFGIPQGDEFQVSVTSGTIQLHKTPSVAMGADGDFVVAWNRYAYEDLERASDVYARRYAANGTPEGPQFRVSNNAYTLSYGSYSYTLFHYQYISNPDVQKDAAGNFIVVWQRSTTDPAFLGDADEQQIIGRRYDANGMSQGGLFKISDGSNQAYILNSKPEVAAHAGGDFVVVWKALEPADAIVGRRFSAAGAPLGGEFLVSSHSFEGAADVESDGSGGFVIVWGSSAVDDAAPYMDVAARRYDATGTPLGAAFRVNTTTSGYQCGPSIAGLDNGNFVVTWHHPFSYNPADDYGFGQVLDSGGNPVGGEFLLDTTGTYVNGASVAAQENDFVVVWADEGYGSSSPDGADVIGQRFGTTAVPSCSPTPLTTCRQQTRRAGVVRFNKKANPAKSRLTWVWSRGESTSHAEFGDPFDDTSYVFCLYDGSAAPQPLATLVAPRGNFCGRVPCWLQLGASDGTIQWINTPGNAYGLTQIRLHPGGDGAAKILVTARGLNLTLPDTPLTARVVMQAQATNGECWSAEYDALITRNEDGVFRAKPTVP